MSAASEIRKMVGRLNAAWVEGRPDDLPQFFHEDVVLAAPDLEKRLVGRDACVQSYRDFISQATVHQFEMKDVEVDVFGAAAVAACPYTIEYQLGERRFRATGRDLLVLVRDGGGWRVVWRT